MSNDVKGIVREVCGYSKISDEDGDHELVVSYKLKPVNLSFLQKLYNIDPNEPEHVLRDLIACYKINETQARALQPYVIDGEIDLQKYNFQLECYAEE